MATKKTTEKTPEKSELQKAYDEAPKVLQTYIGKKEARLQSLTAENYRINKILDALLEKNETK